jgi:uncharacterized protein (TIGR00255 family)
MIRSMTGFASAGFEDQHASISVTIRTVNHRHLDVQLRMPQSLASVEGDIRAAVARHIARGRVEVAVSLQLRLAAGIVVEVNEALVLALNAALAGSRAKHLVSGELTPGDLIRLPQALAIKEVPPENNDALVAEVTAQATRTIDEALAGLASMRETEGHHLRTDLDQRKATVADLVERIAAAADEGRVAMEVRLSERVAEMRAALQADETAVAQEIVRLCARSDISEELTRFRAHVTHWDALSESSEPCGRKLDFLLQEMNREVNTMGSKADGLRVSELIIAAKAELEKMREQVQNVE